MGKSISQAYYERFRKWQIRQNGLQIKFKENHDLDYLGGSNMRGILTAPECRTEARIDKYKPCTISQAEKFLEALDSGDIDRTEFVAWIRR